MKPIKTLAAIAISGVLATSAWAADYEVTRTLQLKHAKADVWRLIGGFCDVDNWHPEIARCDLKVIDGKLHRVLTTSGGSQFVDQRIAKEQGLSYTYGTSEGPLPAGNFISTLSIEPIAPNGGARVTWSANFSSDDPATEAKVIDLIEKGLAGIESSFRAE